MPGPYNAAQLATAQESRDFWLAHGASAWMKDALLADEDGETSFEWWLWGDHHQASGMAQWHLARRNAILTHTGIDIWKSDHPSQLKAMYAEMTESWSAYKHIWAQLLETTDIPSAVTILVQRYEQSGSQARDIARRTDLANYWAKALQ